MGNETIKCPCCEHPGCVVKPGARGGYSASCGACGYQGFMRTPKAADAMRAKLVASHGDPAAPQLVAGDADDLLRKL